MLVRLVLLSDTHGLHREISIPDGDMLIHAGDFCSDGEAVEARSFGEFFRGLPHRHKVVIAGNHDRCLEADPGLGPEVFAGCHYFLGHGVESGGVPFWNSPWQPWFFDMAFNRERGAELREKWELIPAHVEVLITHGPPQAVRDLYRWGSQAPLVRGRIEDNQGDCHARVWHPAEQPGAEDDMRAWPGTMKRIWRPREESHRRLEAGQAGKRRQRRAGLTSEDVAVSQCGSTRWRLSTFRLAGMPSSQLTYRSGTPTHGLLTRGSRRLNCCNRRGGTDDRTCRRLPTSVLLARHSTVSRSRIAGSPPG